MAERQEGKPMKISLPSDIAPTDTSAPDDSLRPYVLGGAAVVFLLVGVLGGWAATSQLAGAVLAQGTVVVDSNVKKVQHPTGGVVGELRVREGDSVKAGDIVLRLDETVTRANLQMVTKQLDELAMRQARLKAERDGLEAVVLPPLLAGREAEPLVLEIIAGERSLFESRRTGRASQKSQLRERTSQIREEIKGLSGQLAAKANEAALVGKELEGLEYLAAKNLVQMTRVNPMRRDAAKLEGEQGQLTAQIAQANGKIAEIELQILQIDQDLRTEIVKELREAQGKEAELVERRIAAEDQLRRVDIRSPQTGTVHQLAVHTVGGVINQSEPLMLIVPDGDKLVIEAKVAQQDIEQVRIGQNAWLRMTAFNQRTTPEVAATVDRVAADLTREQQTGAAYFVARLTIPEHELKKLGQGKLVPGMPVDVQIKTEERTALSYFLKPFSDQIARAFKER
jgi:HlyD family secretion protein